MGAPEHRTAVCLRWSSGIASTNNPVFTTRHNKYGVAWNVHFKLFYLSVTYMYYVLYTWLFQAEKEN